MMSGANEPRERKPSILQSAVYDDVARGVGHTVVRARAGSGKTTTIMGALSSVPKGATVALFAFNKSIAVELGRRAPRGVEVKTLHSHGRSAVRRAFGDVTVDEGRSQNLCVEIFGEPTDEDLDESHPVRSNYRSIAELVGKAKDTLTSAEDLDALDRLADAFGIDAPGEEDEEGRRAFVEAAAEVLRASASAERIARTKTIDFSDMCWLPVVLGLRVWAFDRVFVDETQDLSPCQVELLLKTVRRGGRICAVGDDRQAIYAFRGADVETIPKLVRRLEAKVLPLSVTYRCPRAVVRLARQEVSDLTAADGAEEGIVAPATVEAMIRDAGPGDMIVSRANAPLMGYCLRILASGRRAAVKGREVGAGILKAIERSRAKTVEALLEWASKHHEKEVLRLQKRKRSTAEADDRHACIVAIAEGAEDMDEVFARARSLFAGDDDGEAGRVTLGTTHKLKGLEADRVWMLADTYRRSAGGEEANCWYVAVTRARRVLRVVSEEGTSVLAEKPTRAQAPSDRSTLD